MSNRLYYLMKAREGIAAEFQRCNQLKDQMDMNTIDGMIAGLKSFHGFDPVGILAEDEEFVIVLVKYDDEHEAGDGDDDEDGGPWAFALMYKDKDEPLDIFSSYATPEKAFRASEHECAHVYEADGGKVYGALAYRHLNQ